MPPTVPDEPPSLLSQPQPPSQAPPPAVPAPTDPDQGWGEPRSKTVTWYDPAASARSSLAMSGLEFLRAMVDGTVPPPPISRVFDFRPVTAEVGDVVFTCEPDESAYNPIGLVHGGLVCTLLDTAAGCAVHTTLAVGVAYTSLEIKVNYVRPVQVLPGRVNTLTVHGWVTRPGRRAAFAECDVRDAQGRVVATASSTCLVMGAG
ncbi:PaaI family thioesterase [Parafrankia discariae]|uniref:PaaI family thioesterase n=1 Tax=Parafrankia discariae TaxID=365528 RepID=UPI000A045714|nr:PaaI family thioesterase [Parafrankia discariae]